MIPVKILAVRYLANASPALCAALGAPKGSPSLGLLTTDCDDATYIALDEATKASEDGGLWQKLLRRSIQRLHPQHRGGHRHTGGADPRGGAQRHGGGPGSPGPAGI